MKTIFLQILGYTAFCCALWLGCSDSPSGPSNASLVTESGRLPHDQADDVPRSPSLVWPSSGPVDGTVRYTLYLDTVNLPAVYAANLKDTVFAPDPLHPGQTYYWRVVAKGARQGFPVSPLWSFTTASIRYPVSVGNRWEYTQSIWYENITPLRHIERYNDTIRSSVAVEITDLVIGHDGTGLYRFHYDLVPQGDRTGGDSYYEVRDDGLYHTWAGSGTDYGVGPKQGTGVHYSFGGRSFGSTDDLFAFLEDGLTRPTVALSSDQAALKCLQYPLRVGDQWTYMSPDEGPWRADRRVIDWRQIEIGSGSYTCFVVQHLYFYDSDGRWNEDIEIIDYVASPGLIKRRITLRGVLITDYSRGRGNGRVDVVSEAVLTRAILALD